MKVMIQSKCQGQVAKGDKKMPGSVCPQTAAHTVKTLQHLHFLIFEHPSYSPDPVPSTFHPF
jgi:hypothetical protein